MSPGSGTLAGGAPYLWIEYELLLWLFDGKTAFLELIKGTRLGLCCGFPKSKDT